MRRKRHDCDKNGKINRSEMANRRGDWLQRLHCTLDRRRFDFLVPVETTSSIVEYESDL